MSKRLIVGWVVMGFVLLHVASQAKLAAQPLKCPAEGSPALLQASYPAYSDALDLAQALSHSGFVVQCITRSKQESISETKGAALYITNRGDFDVVFLPKPHTFNALRIIERHKNGEYIYLFRGSPRPATRMEGSKKVYFFKQSNKLFIAWDEQTATSLAEILSSH
jgi:hypothetical protein